MGVYAEGEARELGCGQARLQELETLFATMEFLRALAEVSTVA